MLYVIVLYQNLRCVSLGWSYYFWAKNYYISGNVFKYMITNDILKLQQQGLQLTLF